MKQHLAIITTDCPLALAGNPSNHHRIIPLEAAPRWESEGWRVVWQQECLPHIADQKLREYYPELNWLPRKWPEGDPPRCP